MADAVTGPELVMQRLHEEHASALWSFCVQLTGSDRARAEDVFQETMLRAWRHREHLDVTQGSVRSWLFTVARHVVIDDWRSRKAHGELSVAEVPELSDPEDRTDRLLLTWAVAEALSRLSPAHRDVLRDTYYSGMSVAEAAQHLGVPEGTVKSRTHYALRALRLALQEMGMTP